LLQTLLRNSKLYEMSRKAIGAEREMQTIVDDYIKPHPGIDVLDIGCGNGRLVRFLPSANYVGIDHNQSYIDAAIAEHRATGATFVCGDLGDFPADELGPFDVAVSIGVLHHLDDATATSAIAAAVERLRPNGRLITMDPCFHPDQRQIARVLMALDRGKFVRHPDDYVRLIEPHVASTKVTVSHEVYAFPYTHVITESTRASDGHHG
jgi:2-polyprenyl-3-methyl-5-hydroxy-6-metoxy-1,4-benzoquinol methylase